MVCCSLGDVEFVDFLVVILLFRSCSIRVFMFWEDHVVNSSCVFVCWFFFVLVVKVVVMFERVMGKMFLKLKPNVRFCEVLMFYVVNHMSVLVDGQEMWMSKHTQWLDFELELACVLVRLLVDVMSEEALDAVGGWFILNDWSARDVQADDVCCNIFGLVIKVKIFVNSVGFDVVMVDEIPDWTRATGRVWVDGDVWCEGKIANLQYSFGAMLAYASAGERFDAGDVILIGIMLGCCGLELDRWIKPGQIIELEIDGIGTLSNRLSVSA